MNTVPRFEGRVAVVTGAGRGIGRAVALLLAGEGARVLVCDLGGDVSGDGEDIHVAGAVVDEICCAGGTALAYSADIATMVGARGAVSAALAAWDRIDILFNGAGILRPGRITEMDEESWDAVTRVNMKSVFAMVQHVAPHMIKQKSGSIISCSSPAGYGQYGASAYAATKEALVGFTRSVSRELGEFGIRCNALRPCAASRMFLSEVADDLRYAVEELGLPPVGDQWFPGMNGEEPECLAANVAAVVAWLCLPETEPLNGRELYIAGGHLALCSEPDLVRSRYCSDGWSLSALMEPSVIAHFNYRQSNRYLRST